MLQKYLLLSQLMLLFCLLRTCSGVSLKVLDFSSDNDWETDDMDNYTHATLKKKNLPSSFTICAAFMVEQWTSYKSADLFLLREDNGQIWNAVHIYSATTHTEFKIYLAGLHFHVNSESPFFPLQWTRVAFSFDHFSSTIILVVDGEQVLLKEALNIRSK